MGFSLDMLAEQQDTVNCPLMIPPPGRLRPMRP